MSSSIASPSAQPQPPKPQRVLACVRCQQHKIKCDRRFPCLNCTKSRAQCVPATLIPRGPRKRRFPERELLDRVHQYEDLLRQNNIKFEPLHREAARDNESPNTQGGDESGDDQRGVMGDDALTPTTIRSERVYEAKDFWAALNSGARDPGNDSDSSHDEVREMVVKKGWVQLYGNNDHLLFGSPNMNIDLGTLHPDPVQIFRLWQIYLDNVNPLLKVTHTPSLQGRIIEATSNVTNIGPTLEALMFSIYCMAILSFVADDCQAMFGSSKEDLLTRFQFGCQQALLNCGFLRSSDRDCLTALYLYLISVRQSIVPQSLSAMLGVAIRIAQRMGIHSESALAKCTPLEAELRRRLWWSLVLFDTRVSEMSEHKVSTLAPTWDCKTPLNVDDSDLRPEMKQLPAAQEKSTEALFAVVRSELGDFVRHTMFHLDFTTPALKAIYKTAEHSSIPEVVQLASLEKTIEGKYLKSCDLENPLHFMTIWWMRAYLAKCRLLEHYSRCSSAPVYPTDAQRDTGIVLACRMLECDTKLRMSPLTRRFLWLLQLYFPFPAYLQVVQDLKRRPCSEHAERSWEFLSDNYDARFVFLTEDRHSPVFGIFAKIVLQAWDAREAAFRHIGASLTPPRIVASIRQRVAQAGWDSHVVDLQPPNHGTGSAFDHFPPSVSLDPSNHGLLYDMGVPGGFGDQGMGLFPGMPGQTPVTLPDANHLNWDGMDWGFEGMYRGAWNVGL